ncbi:hypothetical protein ACP70R_008761 [Stipagrostis hirtigluma subsp. patula]
MDDDDDRTTSLLYCHEDPLLVSTPPPPAAAPPVDGLPSSVPAVEDLDDDEELLLAEYAARQRCYAPSTSYLEHLLMEQQQQQQAASHGVSAARAKAVHYILYAFGRLGLAPATAFNAVNYLDRFLSINCHLRWEAWMVELVSVACLSIACKLDEVTIPSLHHLQMEEVMSHSFRSSTIRDMELTLLKALQWRLACVTPYSFLHLLLPQGCTTSAATASRCTRLLLRSLSETSLLRFDSSVIASSALRCVALQGNQQADISCRISRLIHSECQLDNDTDECFEMMNSLYASFNLNNHQMYSDEQWSPISVIPFQTDGTVNRKLTEAEIDLSQARGK